MCMQDQILIPPNFKTSKNSKSLTDPNQNQHALCLTRTLASAAWKVFYNSILQAYQAKLLNYLIVTKNQAQCIIIKLGGGSGVAGVFQGILI